jgi:C_GCAxxG_C_C family probable redox protein
MSAADNPARSPEAEAIACWRGGLFCAESVAVALARHQGIDTDLLPAIASGFCGGMGHTRGPCGAVTGAIIGLGLACGRRGTADSTAAIYAAVGELNDRFTAEFGATDCATLVGCDLATEAGRRSFAERGMHHHCTALVARAAAIAGEIIDRHRAAAG